MDTTGNIKVSTEDVIDILQDPITNRELMLINAQRLKCIVDQYTTTINSHINESILVANGADE